jgi:hypothetical protein
MRVGFGLWTDFDSGKHPWNTKDFDANFFQPETYQSAVFNSLDQSDGYVWVYCERMSWLSGENVPDAYKQAQAAGRSAPGKLPLERIKPNAAQAKWIKTASTRQDPHLFDDLMKNNELLVDLKSSNWKFQIDPENRGPNESWSDIKIEQFWEEQGWDYDGYAWYQTTFEAGAAPKDKKVTLVIGAADESADVWLNAEKVGSHDIGENGWDQRITFDITKTIRDGENTLRIRVLDRSGPGGLWRPVRILVSK